jgi:FeS assembly SUF system regulator
MLRITKQTDYGIMLLAQLAAHPGETRSAPEIAAESQVPLPMTSKILKLLSSGGLLESHRGAHGGYRLKRPAEGITLAEIIRVLEGPIALTECIALGPGECGQEPVCLSRVTWRRINAAVEQALGGITLAEVIQPVRYGRSSRPEDTIALVAASHDAR